MRRLVCVLCLATLILFSHIGQICVVKGTCISKRLALIVLGSDLFVNASEKCFNLMSMWSSFEILYLSSNLSITPRANMTANRANLNWALTTWLKNNSNQSTQIWIWVFSDGYGLFHRPPSAFFAESWKIDGGRPEVNSDEGAEITEDLINIDVNGDGSIGSDTWVGVDENLVLQTPMGEEIIWDDELSQWLTGINYENMIVFMSTCKVPNASASCYGGGFIDDLSAPRRIIISPTNETYYSWANESTGIGWFENLFMDALTPGTPAWAGACDLVVDESRACWGVTSILEAFMYARDHDMARMAVRNPSGNVMDDPWRNVYSRFFEIDESPWLDDGGNFLPTFKNGVDIGAGSGGYDTGDGELAEYNWLAPSRYDGSCIEDVNTDSCVDIFDLSTAASAFGSSYPQKWSSTASLADLNLDNKVDIFDVVPIAIKFGWKR